MKNHIRYLFIALLTAAMVLGCVTPQTALTPGILERMKKMTDYDYKKYPYMLSSPILLNNLEDNSNQTSTPPKIKRTKVGVLFQNNISTTNIMFLKNIRGRALSLQESADEMILRVYFEEKKNEPKYPSSTHFLEFSAKKSDMNSFFYLKYEPGPGRHNLNIEKGSLVYNGKTYDVLFDGATPYLMLWLNQKIEAIDEPPRRILGNFGSFSDIFNRRYK